LRLPRERVAFETSEASSAAAALTPAELLRIGWLLLRPDALAADLEDPTWIPRGEAWVLRGRPATPVAGARLVELAIEPATQAVSLWALIGRSGESLLRVAYDPPLAPEDARSRLTLLAPGLQLRGTLRLHGLQATSLAGRAPPPLPLDWQVVSGEEVADVLAAWAEEQESAARSAAPRRAFD
jgi:hypothetical protein